MVCQTHGRLDKKNCLIQSALVVLLAGGGLQMLTPPIVLANITQQSPTVQLQAGETYETLVQRAVQVAKTAVEKAFAAQEQLNTVLISVSAQNQGTIAPILSLQVSRSQWQAQPNVERWATFYPTSKTLLGFSAPALPTTKAPVPSPTSPARQPEQKPVSGPVQARPVRVDLLPAKPIVPQVINGKPLGGPVPLEQIPDNLLPGMAPQMPVNGNSTAPMSTQPTTVEPTIVQPAMVQPTMVQPGSVESGLILPTP